MPSFEKMANTDVTRAIVGIRPSSLVEALNLTTEYTERSTVHDVGYGADIPVSETKHGPSGAEEFFGQLFKGYQTGDINRFAEIFSDGMVPVNDDDIQKTHQIMKILVDRAVDLGYFKQEQKPLLFAAAHAAVHGNIVDFLDGKDTNYYIENTHTPAKIQNMKDNLLTGTKVLMTGEDPEALLNQQAQQAQQVLGKLTEWMKGAQCLIQDNKQFRFITTDHHAINDVGDVLNDASPLAAKLGSSAVLSKLTPGILNKDVKNMTGIEKNLLVGLYHSVDHCISLKPKASDYTFGGVASTIARALNPKNISSPSRQTTGAMFSVWNEAKQAHASPKPQPRKQ